MIRAMAEINVKENLKAVLARIESACSRRNPEFQDIKPRLVAVSKLKPSQLIIEAYEAGQRHFGENYVQELEDKAKNSEILERCPDIKWHFIGHLQTNKVNKLLSVLNLHIIETVDNKKLATQLNKNWPNFGSPNSMLNVMIQVNTSQEEQKSGIPPSEVSSFAQYIATECKNLRLNGIMTIGQYDYDPSSGPNPDFLSLKKCRDELCKTLGLDWKEVELSMGMSSDFEQAVELGSHNIRVGSSIFGLRPPKT